MNAPGIACITLVALIQGSSFQTLSCESTCGARTPTTSEQVFGRPIRADVPVHLMIRGKEPVQCLQLSHDGHVLATVASRISLWDVGTAKELRSWDNGSNCRWIAFSPDGRNLASLHFLERENKESPLVVRIRIRDTESKGEPGPAKEIVTKRFDCHLRRLSLRVDSDNALAFSPDGSRLAVVMPDESVYVYNVDTGKQFCSLSGAGVALTFSPDGRELQAITHDGAIRTYDVATGVLKAQGSHHQQNYLYVRCAAVSGDRRFLAFTDGITVDVRQPMRQIRDVWHADYEISGLAIASTGTTFVVTQAGSLLIRRPGSVHTARIPSPEKQDPGVSPATAISSDGAYCVWSVYNGSVPGVYALYTKGHSLGPALHKETKATRFPVEARLTARKKLYFLSTAAGGQHLSERIGRGETPPAPDVELLLYVRNKGNTDVAITRGGLLHLYLIGPWALNVPVTPGQVVANPLTGLAEVLRPGQEQRIVVERLESSMEARSYWLVPGQYTIKPFYSTEVDGRWITLECPGVTLTVEAAK